MSKTSLTIVTADASREYVSLQNASELSGMHPEMILEVIRGKLIRTVHEDDRGNLFFDAEAIYRLRQIEYLRTQQQTHMRTIRMIIQLLDRAEAAEKELRWLRQRVR